jgi:cell wall integrity and stress response component
MTYVGCFSSSETLQDRGAYDFQSSGHCQKVCVEQGKPVMGLTGGSNCWCGDLIPVAANKINDSQCDIPCSGYNKDMCKSRAHAPPFSGQLPGN